MNKTEFLNELKFHLQKMDVAEKEAVNKIGASKVLLTVLLLVFSAYIVIWCAPVVTGASCVGFLTSSIVGIIGTPFVLAKSFSIGMIQLGTAISSIGISILLGLLTIYLSKKLIIITKKFTSKLATLVKKKVVIR